MTKRGDQKARMGFYAVSLICVSRPDEAERGGVGIFAASEARRLASAVADAAGSVKYRWSKIPRRGFAEILSRGVRTPVQFGGRSL